MLIREAKTTDIPQIQHVRNAVKENRLSNPGSVSDADCALFLCVKGKGWVCEIDGQIVGFSIVDLVEQNIWALFVHPDFDKRGIGKRLHDSMLEWYFRQTDKTVWLGTEPNTRAAVFYKKAGWAEVGTHGNDEITFEMTHSAWLGMHHS